MNKDSLDKNIFVLLCFVILITFNAINSFAAENKSTLVTDTELTIPIDGYVNSVNFINNGKYLITSSNVYGNKYIEQADKYGVSIFENKGKLNYKKIGFLSTGFGKVIGVGAHVLVFHRGEISPSYSDDVIKKYKPSIKIISINKLDNPIEVGSVITEGRISALSMERKLIAVSNGENIELISFKNKSTPKVVGKFNAKETCKSGYSNKFKKISRIVFSNKGNEIHMLSGRYTLCSYDLKNISSPKLLRGGHVGYGTVLLHDNESLLVLLGAKSGAFTVYKDAAGGKAYDLNKTYDASHNFEKDEYNNSITGSFWKYVKHNNHLIVLSKRFNGEADKFIIYNIKNRALPVIIESYNTKIDYFHVSFVSVTPNMSHIVAGLNERIIFIPLVKTSMGSLEQIKKHHKKALKIYSQFPNKYGAEQAVNILNTSGMGKLKNNRHVGISSKMQAHVLNDYGYFLFKSGDIESSLKYLKSAVRYDYERATAHYNLAEIYTAKLKIDTSRSKEEFLAKINVHCGYYTKLVGRKNNCGGEYYLKKTLSEADSTICSFVKDAVLNEKFGEILSYPDYIDVNNDGVLESINKISQGTAHIESIGVYDKNKKFVFSPTGEYDWNGSLTNEQDVLPYQGYYYFALHNAGVPVQIVRSNQDYSEEVICSVKNVKREPFLIKGKNNLFCKTLPAIVIKGEKVSSSSISIPARAAHPYEILDVDFNNDGSKERIVKILYASGAGAGCDAEWDDVLNNKNEINESHPSRETLLTLQEVDYSSRYPGNCGNMSTKWVFHDGKTYIDRTFYGVHMWSSDLYRKIHFIKGNEADLICEFRYKNVIEFH